jgi:hypothetical protein
VPLPDIRGRQQILELYTKKTPIDADVDLEMLARGTPGEGPTGADNVVAPLSCLPWCVIGRLIVLEWRWGWSDIHARSDWVSGPTVVMKDLLDR